MDNKKATVPYLSVGADREQPKQLRKTSIADWIIKNNCAFEKLQPKPDMGRWMRSG